ncbi:MAG: hypothetical protein O7G86_10325, partial [Gammaproteobacteria bacterium]|nr:hypothetical protein [Gammaproteobacteria bacterium]
SVSSYDVDRLRTAAIETDLDKFDTALGPFTVRDLRIVRQNVFPQKHHWLARQTNRFHLLTREWVLERWSLFVRGSYTLTRNLPDHRQLRLGGDTNLRGYPSRYQIGDRQYLFTMEERYYTDLVPFGMFRVGWAAFVDVGRAWYAGTAPAWVPERTGDHFKMLSNLGLGLRLESIRTRRDRVIHVDIAKPLVDGPEVDSYELTLTVKQTI